MKNHEHIKELISITGSGFGADVIVKGRLGSTIKREVPFHALELKDIEDLLILIKDSPFPHVYCENDTFYFTAYYYHDELYPIGRSYFIRTCDLFEVANIYRMITERGFSLPIIPPFELSEKIRSEGYENRIKKYIKRISIETKTFGEIFKGRKSSTNVNESMYINSPGCLVCGKKIHAMVSSTLSSTNGFMFGYNLCLEHMHIAESKGGVLEYFLSHSNFQMPGQLVPLNSKNHMECVIAWLPKILGCTVDKIKNNTVTMTRESGMKIILRLDAMDNYGYMFFNSSGVQISRVDSADHHPVDYGPDHLHPNLLKDESKVVSSFTTGSPLIDTKLILKLISKIENSEIVA